MKEYIAFDIGGTQIKYGIVSETGIVLKHKTVPTEIHLGGEQIIQNSFFYQKLMSEHTISELVLVLRELLTLIKDCDGRADHIPGYSTIPIINRLQEVLKFLYLLIMM